MRGQSASLDYDSLAQTYDERYRAGMPSGILELLAELASNSPAGAWLEAGCGTGAWLAQLSVAGPLVGLDRSRQMLRLAAQTAPSASLLQAEAAHPPLAPGSLCTILCINALHHFPDAQNFIHHAGRMLKPGGRLLIVGFDPFDDDLAWPVYDYFAGVRERDRSRYPPFSDVDAWLSQSGFRLLDAGVAVQIEQVQTGEQLMQDPFMTPHGTSQLALLEPAEYARGVDRLRSEMARSPGIRFTTRLRIRFRLARRSSGATGDE